MRKRCVVNSGFIFLTMFLCTGALIAQPDRGQEPPALILETRQEISTSRGSTVQSFQISSSILKQSRRIYVVLPASFLHTGPGRKYPVMIVLDGEDNVPPVAAVSDELSRNGQIPEAIIVAIPNVEGATDQISAENRVHDLTPPGLSVSGSSLNEGGDLFLDFVEKELLPAVDRQLRGAGPRIFIGHSSGGILATYVAATRSAFRAVIAIDAPTKFGENWLPKKLVAQAGASSTPLRYASYEARFGWSDEMWQKLTAAAPSSWNLHREHRGDETHESIGMLAMYLGLREVFNDYSTRSAPVAPTTSILSYYAKVGAALGADVTPPRRLLRNVVEDLLMEGWGRAARAAYMMLVSGYGAPSDSTALLGQIAEVEHRPPPSETVEGLLSTPFPSPEEMREYLGDWVGDAWMSPEEPRSNKITLRIKVVDGRVVGETDYRMGDLVMRWEYLKVTPAGITWGFMNGMRPRGVILSEGKREGDTLTGEDRFGGVDVRRPDGSRPPSVHFSFRHVRK